MGDFEALIASKWFWRRRVIFLHDFQLRGFGWSNHVCTGTQLLIGAYQAMEGPVDAAAQACL